MSLAVVLSWLLRLLLTAIPVPVALIGAVLIWWQVDRTSSVRRAVAETVAGEELAEERARLASVIEVQREIERQRDRLAEANAAFGLAAERDRSAIDALESDIRKTRSSPVSRSCSVDDALLERLRSR